MRELHMRRTNRIIPTYTGDVSGACSALFELGGMVVIHDPSGCNSTYNTHDETRWYDYDSLIFITGLTERDAVLGNDDKLVHDVVDAARELQPRFVALCNSPIPFISGTDFRAICKLVERECGIPCFYVRTNAMHDYVVGGGNALVAVAERFVETGRPVRPGTANILGATPLDLGVAGSDITLRTFVQSAGFEVVSCWAMGSSLDELAQAGEAEVNLVVSALGLPVAKYLHERCGTPYVVGMPVGALSGDRAGETWGRDLAGALAYATESRTCVWPARDRRKNLGSGIDKGTADNDTWTLVGEPVVMGSVAAALECAGVSSTRVLCPLEADRELLGPNDAFVEGEEGAEEALAGVAHVVADELYAPIIPEDCVLHVLPHQAFSGRNSWKGSTDLATLVIARMVER